MGLGDFLSDVNNAISILTDNGDANAFTYHDWGDLVYDISRRMWVAFYLYVPGQMAKQQALQRKKQIDYNLENKLKDVQQKRQQLNNTLDQFKTNPDQALKSVVTNAVTGVVNKMLTGRGGFVTAITGDSLADDSYIKLAGGAAWVQDVSFSYQQQIVPVYHTGAQRYTNMSLPFFNGVVTYRKLYYINIIDEDGNNRLPDNWDMLLRDYFSAPNPFVRGVFVKAIDDSDAKLIAQAIADYQSQFGGGFLGVLKGIVKGLISRVMAIVDKVFPVSKLVKFAAQWFDGSWEAQLEAALGSVPRGEIYIGKPAGYSLTTAAGSPLAFESLNIVVDKIIPPPKIDRGPLYRDKLLHEIVRFLS
jgi:hypothetical protein